MQVAQCMHLGTESITVNMRVSSECRQKCSSLEKVTEGSTQLPYCWLQAVQVKGGCATLQLSLQNGVQQASDRNQMHTCPD